MNFRKGDLLMLVPETRQFAASPGAIVRVISTDLAEYCQENDQLEPDEDDLNNIKIEWVCDLAKGQEAGWYNSLDFVPHIEVPLDTIDDVEAYLNA